MARTAMTRAKKGP